jgi:hypothetical protein
MSPSEKMTAPASKRKRVTCSAIREISSPERSVKSGTRRSVAIKFCFVDSMETL